MEIWKRGYETWKIEWEVPIYFYSVFQKESVDIQSNNEERKILLQFTYYIVGLCRKPKIIHREIN